MLRFLCFLFCFVPEKGKLKVATEIGLFSLFNSMSKVILRQNDVGPWYQIEDNFVILRNKGLSKLCLFSRNLQFKLYRGNG